MSKKRLTMKLEIFPGETGESRVVERVTVMELVCGKDNSCSIALPNISRRIPACVMEMNIYYQGPNLKVVCPFCGRHRSSKRLINWRGRCNKCGAWMHFSFTHQHFVCLAAMEFMQPEKNIQKPDNRPC